LVIKINNDYNLAEKYTRMLSQKVKTFKIDAQLKDIYL